jgi:phenylpropionate dioxygenase-like ring-hydroxylating dioxygenase large terminal subunit
MSGSGIQSHAASQLPVSSYFDPALYAREMQTIFGNMPRYVGHELCIPHEGHYHTLQQEGAGRALLRSARGIELISNVCRHRQAIMLQDRGVQKGQIVCPLHRWTYDISGKTQAAGQLIGAPHFDQDPCLHLNNYPLQNWNGLLFDVSQGGNAQTDLAAMQALRKFNFEGFVYDRTELHWCNYNWKTFIEVYLEDYHVGPFHPGLGQFVTCDDLQWEMGQHYSVQTVGVADKLGRPGSAVYRRWHDAVLNHQGGDPPKYGAVWLTYYPTVMVEWYPNVLVVSTLFPHGPQKTLNMVEFFYPEEIAAFEREYIEAQQSAYMETCIEDDEIAERMDAGRRALLARGDNECGPYQSPMEDGMEHFHHWYRRMMNGQM